LIDQGRITSSQNRKGDNLSHLSRPTLRMLDNYGRADASALNPTNRRNSCNPVERNLAIISGCLTMK
jgi:hypothetical protein